MVFRRKKREPEAVESVDLPRSLVVEVERIASLTGISVADAFERLLSRGIANAQGCYELDVEHADDPEQLRRDQAAAIGLMRGDDYTPVYLGPPDFDLDVEIDHDDEVEVPSAPENRGEQRGATEA